MSFFNGFADEISKQASVNEDLKHFFRTLQPKGSRDSVEELRNKGSLLGGATGASLGAAMGKKFSAGRGVAGGGIGVLYGHFAPEIKRFLGNIKKRDS